MIGSLIVVGIIFYGVLYSGLRSLPASPFGPPISTLDALRGKEAPKPASAVGAAAPTPAPRHYTATAGGRRR